MLKKILLATSVAASLYSGSALAAMTTESDDNNYPTLKALDNAAEESVIRVEREFKENAGAALSAAYSILTTDNTTNPFIDAITVNTDYSIAITLKGSLATNTDYKKTTFGGKGVTGDKFLLIPIYNTGSETTNSTNDTKITSWQCFTNTDDKFTAFMGDAGTREDKKSAALSKSAYPLIRDCIFKLTSGTTSIW